MKSRYLHDWWYKYDSIFRTYHTTFLGIPFLIRFIFATLILERIYFSMEIEAALINEVAR